MRIALIQQSAKADISENRRRGLQAAQNAAEQGAEVICFAELAFSPFYPQLEATEDARKNAEPIPGPTTELFQEFAQQHGVVVVLNLFERDGEKTFDSSPVIDADGQLLGITRMVHITDYPCFYEKGYYAPGNFVACSEKSNAPNSTSGPVVYQTKFGRIGVAICYDRHYPEYMRYLALAGAELVVIPQAGAMDEWPEGLFEAELRVAAFQNGYFTALCNRVGVEPKLTFAGESFVCNPAGCVIGRAAKGKADTLICDIDLSEVQQSHAKKLFLRDRRPELYREWFAH
jgi:N-carbamoylputrescine amidase